MYYINVKGGVNINKILSIIFTLIFIFPTQFNEDIERLNLNSKNYILYSVDADEVIASKNNDVKLAAASMNKLLTTITILDYLGDANLDEEVVVSQEVLNTVHYTASKADLYAGQVISLRELFSAILMPSGADAIAVFYDYLFETPENLVDAMNIKAQEIGMTNTNIVNPFGLDTEGQYTTLDDLLTLLKYNLQNEEFRKLYGNKQYTLINDQDIVFENENLMFAEEVGFTFMLGAKSGYTYSAEQSLSSYASNNEQTYIFISTQAGLKHGENFKPAQDAIKVYNYLFDNFSKFDLVGKNQVVSQLNLKGRIRPISIKSEAISGIASNQFDKSLFSVEVIYEEDIKAPIAKDTNIGSINYVYDDIVIHSEPIVMSHKVNVSLIYRLVPLALVLGILAILTFYIKFKMKVKNN